MENIYSTKTMGEAIKGNSYVGRGVVIGKSASGKYAATAYFIMGRSDNSRNRIFEEKAGEVTIYPFDESKVKDPSLIIYSPVRRYKNCVIVTNGDQTDTIYDGLAIGKDMRESLKTRCFEPDSPNFTPRISGVMELKKDGFFYSLSILKSADKEGSGCNRFTFDYFPVSGVGHFIHTYVCDGSPLPTFQGEPERVYIPDEIDDFTRDIWENLDGENKISLFVKYVDLSTGEEENRLINKYAKEQ